MARGRRHGPRASGTEDEQEVGAGTDDDAVETLLECGERLKRYARQDVEAKAEANAREVAEWLLRAETALRGAEQGDQEVQRACQNTFAKAVFMVLTGKGEGGGGSSHSRKHGRGNRGGGAMAGEALTHSKEGATALLVSARCACCFALLLRLFAPQPCFSDQQLEQVFSNGLFHHERGLVPRLCRGECGPKTAARSKKKQAVEARKELFSRGYFVLETLKECKAHLLVLDFPTDDCLRLVLTSCFACVTGENASETREVVAGIAGELLKEGGSDLGPGPWECFLNEVAGTGPGGQLPPLERRCERIGGAHHSGSGGGAAFAVPAAGDEEEEDYGGGDGEDAEPTSSAIVARDLLRSCAADLAPHVQKFLDRLITGNLPHSDLRDPRRLHNLLYAMYKTEKGVLLPVLPKLARDLTHALEPNRIQALDLCGHFLVSSFGPAFAREYHSSVFSEFLDRFHDRSASVRHRCVMIAQCVLLRHMRENNNAIGLGDGLGQQLSGGGSHDLAASCFLSLNERVMDPSDRVRASAVCALGRILALNPSALSATQFDSFQGRLRDSKVNVRVACAESLAEAFRCHIRRVHAEGGTWQDEERLGPVPASLLRCYCQDTELRTAPSSSGRSGKAPPALEHALSRGLWPESLTEEEVLRHWVVIHANEAAAAAAALEGEEENEAVGQSQQRGESQLARLLQQKSALRNSVRQLLSLRRGWKQEKASGGDAAAVGRWERRLRDLCTRVARFWLGYLDSNDSLWRCAMLRDERVFDLLESLTKAGREDAPGDGNDEDRTDLLACVSHDKELRSCLARLVDQLRPGPISEGHIDSLLEILSAEGEGEGESAAFAGHCRNFASMVAMRDPHLFQHPSATRVLLSMLTSASQASSLLGLELLHASRAGRSAGAAVGPGSEEEEAIVRYVSSPKLDISGKAISVLAGLAGEERSRDLLRGESRRWLRSLNGGGTAAAFSVVGSIAEHAPGILQDSALDVVGAVCSALTSPPAPPAMGEAEHTPKASTCAPRDLLCAALNCLGQVLCPKDPAWRLPKDLESCVPQALEHCAALLEPDNAVAAHAGLSAKQEASVRLSSARCVLRVATRFDRLVPFDVQTKLSLVMQDPDRGVRRDFADDLGASVSRFQRQRPPQSHLAAKHAAWLALAGADPNRENRQLATRQIVRYVVHAAENLRRLGERDRRSGLVVMRPEFSLVYVIHALAHHSDYPTASEAEEFGVNESYAPFQQMILFYLDALSREGNYRDDRKGKAKRGGAGGGNLVFEADASLVEAVCKKVGECDDARGGTQGGTRVLAELCRLLAAKLGVGGASAPPVAEDGEDGEAAAAPASSHGHRVPLPTNLYSPRAPGGGGLGGLKPVLPAGLDLASTGVTENFSAKKKGIKLEGGGGGKKKAKSPKRKSPDSTPSPGNRRRRRRRRTTPEGKKGAVLSPAAANVKRERPGRAAKSKAAAAIAADGGQENGEASSDISLGVSV